MLIVSDILLEGTSVVLWWRWCLNVPVTSADSRGLSLKVLPEQISSSWRRHQKKKKGQKQGLDPAREPGSGTKPGREGSCAGGVEPGQEHSLPPGGRNQENRLAKGMWCHEQPTSVSSESTI